MQVEAKLGCSGIIGETSMTAAELERQGVPEGKVSERGGRGCSCRPWRGR